MTASAPAPQVGIGLRQPHYRHFDGPPAERPRTGFVEVHSENFFADGGAALAVLHGVRETHAVSLHGVGLALGSAAGLDDWPSTISSTAPGGMSRTVRSSVDSALYAGITTTTFGLAPSPIAPTKLTASPVCSRGLPAWPVSRADGRAGLLHRPSEVAAAIQACPRPEILGQESDLGGLVIAPGVGAAVDF